MPGRAGISDTEPALASAASSGTSSSAEMSTDGARFSRSRVLTAASSPPPVTSGGLPSKLTRMGKVRIPLSSHHQPLGRRIGEALGRKLDLEPVELLRHDDLAAQPRTLIDVEGPTQHSPLFAARRCELRPPFLPPPHRAGGAGARPAALGLDGKAPV